MTSSICTSSPPDGSSAHRVPSCAYFWGRLRDFHDYLVSGGAPDIDLRELDGWVAKGSVRVSANLVTERGVPALQKALRCRTGTILPQKWSFLPECWVTAPVCDGVKPRCSGSTTSIRGLTFYRFAHRSLHSSRMQPSAGFPSRVSWLDELTIRIL